MSLFDRFKKKENPEKGKYSPKILPVAARTPSDEKSVKNAVNTSAPVAPEKSKEKKEAPKTPRVVRKNSGSYRILLAPVVTEKAAHLQARGQYAFEVNPHVTKNEVAKAVEDAYGVKPVAVNVLSVIKKYRRYGRHEGFTKSRKKAIVTLKKGDRIELFETTS